MRIFYLQMFNFESSIVFYSISNFPCGFKVLDDLSDVLNAVIFIVTVFLPCRNVSNMK